jgi:hypothetical protein
VDADVRSHLGHREARRVRREHALRLRVLAQLGEDLLLQRGLFEHRLEDEVAVGEVLVRRRRGDEAGEEAGLAFVVAALGDLLGQSFVDARAGALKRLLVDVAHRDGDLQAADEERRQLSGHQAGAD